MMFPFTVIRCSIREKVHDHCGSVTATLFTHFLNSKITLSMALKRFNSVYTYVIKIPSFRIVKVMFCENEVKFAGVSFRFLNNLPYIPTL